MPWKNQFVKTRDLSGSCAERFKFGVKKRTLWILFSKTLKVENTNNVVKFCKTVFKVYNKPFISSYRSSNRTEGVCVGNNIGFKLFKIIAPCDNLTAVLKHYLLPITSIPFIRINHYSPTTIKLLILCLFDCPIDCPSKCRERGPQ